MFGGLESQQRFRQPLIYDFWPAAWIWPGVKAATTAGLGSSSKGQTDPLPLKSGTNVLSQAGLASASFSLCAWFVIARSKQAKRRSQSSSSDSSSSSSTEDEEDMYCSQHIWTMPPNPQNTESWKSDGNAMGNLKCWMVLRVPIPSGTSTWNIIHDTPLIARTPRASKDRAPIDTLPIMSQAWKHWPRPCSLSGLCDRTLGQRSDSERGRPHHHAPWRKPRVPCVCVLHSMNLVGGTKKQWQVFLVNTAISAGGLHVLLVYFFFDPNYFFFDPWN